MSSGKGVGDPTFVGWAVCFLYAIAGMMALIEARRCHVRLLFRDRWFWLCGGIGLFLLSLNKQIDLQTLLIDGARAFTKNHHLWEQRRIIQLTTFCFLGGGSAIAVTIWGRSLKALKLRFPLAIYGYGLIGTYILIRVFCINHLERFVGLHWREVPALQVIEIAGIACVILQAVLPRLDGQRHQKSVIGDR